MGSINDLANAFWKWAGYSLSWKKIDISKTLMEPLGFPGFEEMKNTCISFINKSLLEEDVDAFLLCMALDEEDECILDACKERANATFLCTIISRGITFPQSNARWQVAELLRREDVPNRQQYLSVLCADPHPYVRKRAHNVALGGRVL